MRSGKGRPSSGSERGSAPSPTIGFLTHYFSRDHISVSIWRGITDQAREENVNLICFPGNAPYSPTDFDAQANVIYKLVDHRNLDGLLVWGSGMLGATSAENINYLFDSLREYPMINIGLSLPGIPGILIDNYRGMREACDHVIERHGCRRIAFLRGPDGHEEAEIRFSAYRDSLKDHGLEYDPRLVIPGNFLRAEAAASVRAFLNERREEPPDAIVGVNDLSALGVVDALNEKRVAIPDEVKVVGFDDLEEGQYLRVPLTTVRQPFLEIGKMAVKTLLARMRGEDVPLVATFPSSLIVRQSCGCLHPLVTQSAINLAVGEAAAEHVSASAAAETLSSVLARDHAAFLVHQANRSGTIERLSKAAADEIIDGAGTFLTAFGRELSRSNGQDDIDFFHSILSALRRFFLPFAASEKEKLLQAENLWQQSRILVCDFARRLAILAGYKKSMQNEILQNVNRILITSFDLEEFFQSLAEALAQLDLTCCFLSLYEDRRSYDFSRLRLAFVDGRRLDIGREGIRFPSVELAPPGLLPQNRRTNFIIQPLYFESEQLGFVVLEEGSEQGIVNEILRAQLSAAVQGALLFQEKVRLLAALEQRARELQERTDDLARANDDLEQFAVIASHDLQEPLRKISLFADRLKAVDDGRAAGERRDYLDRMQAACLRMKSLIRDLLTYSRLSSQVANFTDVDPAAVVRLALLDLGDAVRGVRAEISVDELPSFPGEEHNLRLLFYHLIGNAIKFQPAAQTPQVRIFGRTLSRDGRPHCEITVADNGIGIDPKYFDKIFGVFQRLHGAREFEGTGMGLAVCKKIVERHKGSIRIESEPGKGARFIVTLPRPAGTVRLSGGNETDRGR